MAVPTSLRFMEMQARTYRRVWKGSMFTSFISPTLYLLAMGVGLGSLVDAGSGSTAFGELTYLQWLAPGLIAATAMQTSAGEASFPVMAGIKWQKTYQLALNSPLGALKSSVDSLQSLRTRSATDRRLTPEKVDGIRGALLDGAAQATAKSSSGNNTGGNQPDSSATR